ncbi:MAG TPA: cupin, partial [Myxococcaceae bacterium]|nr:cupin [Myxococcaceae bacterium]
VQRGKLLFVIDEGSGLVERVMGAGESYHIRPGMKHRMMALEDCDILEVSTPELDDVVRLEDAYGRAGTSKA